MAVAPTPTTSRVEWLIQLVTVGGVTFPIARLIVQLYLGPSPADPEGSPERCWLDTGAPLSVVPFHVHSQGLIWQPLGIKTTWSGQPCDLGRVDVWLPTNQPPHVRGPLSLLAKFPQSDPPGDPVPILLGLEFLLTYQTELHLASPPRQGALVLP